jgi:hypothetical protein
MRNYKDRRAANEHMGKRSVSIHEAKRVAPNMGPREQLQTWGQENRPQTKGKDSGQQSMRPRKQPATGILRPQLTKRMTRKPLFLKELSQNKGQRNRCLLTGG